MITGDAADTMLIATPLIYRATIESATDATEHIAESAERLYTLVAPDIPLHTWLMVKAGLFADIDMLCHAKLIDSELVDSVQVNAVTPPVIAAWSVVYVPPLGRTVTVLSATVYPLTARMNPMTCQIIALHYGKVKLAGDLLNCCHCLPPCWIWAEHWGRELHPYWDQAAHWDQAAYSVAGSPLHRV